MKLLLLLTWFAAEPPRLELRAEPASLFVGQTGEMVALLTWPTPLPAEPATLLLPWLEDELPGLIPRAEPLHWLERTFSPHGAGMPVTFGNRPGTWRATAPHRYELRWSFRIAATERREIAVPPTEFSAGGVTLRSDPLRLRIKPLPLPDQPLPAWQLGVGRFDVQTRLRPREIVSGGEVEFELAVRGDGDLSAVPPPPLANEPGWVPDRFRIVPLPPSGSASDAERVFRFRIQVRSAASLTFPTLRWSYFDPALARYQRREISGLHLTITAAAAAPGAVGLPDSPRLQLAASETVLNPPWRTDERLSAAAGAVLLLWLALFLLWIACWRYFGWPGVSPACACRAQVRRACRRAERAISAHESITSADLHPILEQFQAELPPRIWAYAPMELKNGMLDLLAAAEAARYGPPHTEHTQLVEKLRRTVAAWRAIRCS